MCDLHWTGRLHVPSIERAEAHRQLARAMLDAQMATLEPLIGWERAAALSDAMTTYGAAAEMATVARLLGVVHAILGVDDDVLVPPGALR